MATVHCKTSNHALRAYLTEYNRLQWVGPEDAMAAMLHMTAEEAIQYAEENGIAPARLWAFVTTVAERVAAKKQPPLQECCWVSSFYHHCRSSQSKTAFMRELKQLSKKFPLVKVEIFVHAKECIARIKVLNRNAA